MPVTNTIGNIVNCRDFACDICLSQARLAIFIFIFYFVFNLVTGGTEPMMVVMLFVLEGPPLMNLCTTTDGCDYDGPLKVAPHSPDAFPAPFTIRSPRNRPNLSSLH